MTCVIQHTQFTHPLDTKDKIAVSNYGNLSSAIADARFVNLQQFWHDGKLYRRTWWDYHEVGYEPKRLRLRWRWPFFFSP